MAQMGGRHKDKTSRWGVWGGKRKIKIYMHLLIFASMCFQTLFGKNLNSHCEWPGWTGFKVSISGQRLVCWRWSWQAGVTKEEDSEGGYEDSWCRVKALGEMRQTRRGSRRRQMIWLLICLFNWIEFAHWDMQPFTSLWFDFSSNNIHVFFIYEKNRFIVTTKTNVLSAHLFLFPLIIYLTHFKVRVCHLCPLNNSPFATCVKNI